MTSGARPIQDAALRLLFLSSGGICGLYLTSRILFQRSRCAAHQETASGHHTTLVVLDQLIWLSVLLALRQTAAAISAYSQRWPSSAHFAALYQMWFYKPGRAPPARVVVVGADSPGLHSARLDKMFGHHKNLEIVLIDRKNYFIFPPFCQRFGRNHRTRQVTQSTGDL